MLTAQLIDRYYKIVQALPVVLAIYTVSYLMYLILRKESIVNCTM